MRVRTVQELRTEYDALCQRLLGMSGDEFERRSWTEIWPDSPAVDHLLFILDAMTPEKERLRRLRSVQRLLDAETPT